MGETEYFNRLRRLAPRQNTNRHLGRLDEPSVHFFQIFYSWLASCPVARHSPAKRRFSSAAIRLPYACPAEA